MSSNAYDNSNRNGPEDGQQPQYDNAAAGMDPDGVIESNWDQVVTSFDDMNLKEELLRGIYAYGFRKPSAIQQRAILPCIQGRNVITQSQYRTGKTATFSIAILQQIDINLNECQALILVPTRESANQTTKLITALGTNIQCSSIDMVSYNDNERQMNSHVVIGTPGRVFDMINRAVLKTDHIKLFVLDQADEMLSRGFKDQIYDVFKPLGREVQVILQSETMSPDVLEFTETSMSEPISILVRKEKPTLKRIVQFYVHHDREKWKFDTLSDLYHTMDIKQAIIFCNTKKKVDRLTKRMKEKGFVVDRIHSNMSLHERTSVVQQFCNSPALSLVVTDLAKGFYELDRATIVINYDLPVLANYECRIGRISRLDRLRLVVNFGTHADKSRIKLIRNEHKLGELPLYFYTKHSDQNPLMNGEVTERRIRAARAARNAVPYGRAGGRGRDRARGNGGAGAPGGGLPGAPGGGPPGPGNRRSRSPNGPPGIDLDVEIFIYYYHLRSEYFRHHFDEMESRVRSLVRSLDNERRAALIDSIKVNRLCVLVPENDEQTLRGFREIHERVDQVGERHRDEHRRCSDSLRCVNFSHFYDLAQDQRRAILQGQN